MKLKPGVRVLGIRPELVLALLVLRDLYTEYGVGSACVVTSVIEGEHRRASLHLAGAAVDLRHPGAQVARQLVAAAQAQLGEEYDVLLEADHVHVEFQPKTA